MTDQVEATAAVAKRTNRTKGQILTAKVAKANEKIAKLATEVMDYAAKTKQKVVFADQELQIVKDE